MKPPAAQRKRRGLSLTHLVLKTMIAMKLAKRVSKTRPTQIDMSRLTGAMGVKAPPTDSHSSGGSK